MNTVMRRGWRWVIPATTSVALLAVLLAFLDLDAARALWRRTDPQALVLGGALFSATLVVRALRFWWLLGRLAPEARVRPLQAFDLTSINNLGNHVLPLRLGELSFIFLAQTRFGVSVERGSLVLLVARVGDLIGLSVVLLMGALLAPQLVGAGGRVALGVGIVALLALVWWLQPSIQVACRLGGRALALLRPASRVRMTLSGLLQRLNQASEPLSRRRIALANAVASVAVWALLMACFWALMTAFQIPLGVGELVLGSAGAALLPLAPVSALGTLGPLEAGWAAGFLAVGVSRADAIASGVVMHAVVIAVSAVAAGAALARIGPAAVADFSAWRRSRARGTKEDEG